MRKEITAALNQLIPIGWAGQDGKVNTRKGKTEPDPAKHYQYGKNPRITQAQLRTASVDWRDREPF